MKQTSARRSGCSSAIRKPGERSAIIYSIIESCRRRALDPHGYLRDVLTRLQTLTIWQIKDITPESCGKVPGKHAVLKAAA